MISWTSEVVGWVGVGEKEGWAGAGEKEGNKQNKN